MFISLQHNMRVLNKRYLCELSLWNSVSVEDDPRRFEPRRLVELYEQLLHHVRQVRDDFLPMLLHSDGGGITTRVGVHTTDNLLQKTSHILHLHACSPLSKSVQGLNHFRVTMKTWISSPFVSLPSWMIICPEMVHQLLTRNWTLPKAMHHCIRMNGPSIYQCYYIIDTLKRFNDRSIVNGASTVDEKFSYRARSYSYPHLTSKRNRTKTYGSYRRLRMISRRRVRDICAYKYHRLMEYRGPKV